MKTKYFNDAVIGNKNMVASFSKKGELLRLLYPQVDNRQFIDFLYTGMQINDSSMIYLHDDENNTYTQKYIENTNILTTEIYNSYFKIRVTQTDFIDIKNDVLIKNYTFKNENKIDLNVNFLIYSKLIDELNNKISGYFNNDTLMQYMHDYTFCIFSKNKPNSYQINDNSSNINSGKIGGKDYIGMSNDSSLSYDIETIKPGETKSIDICITIQKNEEKNTQKQVQENIAMLKNLDYKKQYEDTKKYWQKYLKEHDTIRLKEAKTALDKKIKDIYVRTILLYPLLINNTTGGISAAVEVDEHMTKCGRYSFCWPRDAIFITKALDILNMHKETEKFYKSFCKNTQSKNGMWEQRFFTDGTLAPCWGYQIDETASVVYGVYDHYQKVKDVKFLKDNLKMCEKAIHFLEKYIEGVLQNKDEQIQSYDIWEMHEGVSVYSLATVFSAFDTMIKINNKVKPEYETNRLKIEQINKQNIRLEKILRQLKEYILNNFYDEKTKSFVRSKDNKMDISLLGLVTPFELFTAKDKKIKNTVERINLTLRTYTGGYLRFEQDSYIGGKNPWVIATLWMADYYLQAGEKTKAKACFKYVVNTASELGFLGEQVDNQTGKPAWVIGLGWSHAMFVTVLDKLLKSA